MRRVTIYDKLPNMITRVVIQKDVEKKFERDLREGLFKEEVRDLIEYWVTEIEDVGYEEYKKSELFKMLDDHALNADRQGQRSITLDQTGGRLIYNVIKQAVVVKVIRITSRHDYS